MKKRHLFLTTAIAAAAVVVVPTDNVEAAQFKDLKPGTEMASAVNELAAKGVVSGYKDGTFRPNTLIKRDEAAKIIALALKLDLSSYYEEVFTDVESNVNKDYIYALGNAGIIRTNSEKFNPKSNITRGQMAKMLTIGFNLQKGSAPPFKDVKNAEAKQYVGSLYKYGITTGTTPTTFGTSKNVTRGQLAMFIHRALKATANSRQVFNSTEFNGPYINGSVNHYFSDGSIKMKFENQSGNNSSIQVEAVKPGTSYFYIGAFEDNHENTYTGPISYYRADVKLVGGKLNLTTKLLDKPLVEPAEYFITTNISDYELTNVDGSPADEEAYEIVTEDGYQMINFYGEPNEYFLNQTLKTGEKRVIGIKYKVNEPTSELITGEYVPQHFVLTKERLLNDHFISEVQSIDVTPFVNGWDKVSPNALTAEVVDGSVHISIIGEGINNIEMTSASGEKLERMFIVHKFGEGYIVSF